MDTISTKHRKPAFIDSLYSDIDSLHLFAGSHEILYEYHRLLARRFPFAIFYRLCDDVLQIWAIDCRQDPTKTETRLT